MNNLPAITTLVFGILAIVGGAIGYKQAGSQMSLISGLISGLLLLVGAYLMFEANQAGATLSGIVSGLLVVVFVMRLIKTKKFMPAGLMISFGIVNLLTLLSMA